MVNFCLTFHVRCGPARFIEPWLSFANIIFSESSVYHDPQKVFVDRKGISNEIGTKPEFSEKFQRNKIKTSVRPSDVDSGKRVRRTLGPSRKIFSLNLSMEQILPVSFLALRLKRGFPRKYIFFGETINLLCSGIKTV